jgi:putative FmdB family regulatory protein
VYLEIKEKIMPIYLYRCRHCGNKIELLRGMNEKDGELACPECGAKEMTKVMLPFYSNIRGGSGGISFG